MKAYASVYRSNHQIDVYDILGLEGLSRGLKIFLQKIKIPQFHLTTFNNGQKLVQMKISPNTQCIRPIVVCAVLRNINFTSENYNIANGTYDPDTKVEEVDGKVIRYSPDLDDRSENVSVNKVNQRIGINVDAQTAATLLNRMSLRTKVLDSDTLRVDISVLKTVPKTSCIRNQFELNRVSDFIQDSVAESGFTEVLTFTLCSIPDVAKKF